MSTVSRGAFFLELGMVVGVFAALLATPIFGGGDIPLLGVIALLLLARPAIGRMRDAGLPPARLALAGGPLFAAALFVLIAGGLTDPFAGTPASAAPPFGPSAAAILIAAPWVVGISLAVCAAILLTWLLRPGRGAP